MANDARSTVIASVAFGDTNTPFESVQYLPIMKFGVLRYSEDYVITGVVGNGHFSLGSKAHNLTG